MKSVCLLIIFLVVLQSAFSQVSIGAPLPAPSAMLDVTSQTKGILVPRMTALERSKIQTPAVGLLVFQTDGKSGFYYFSGSDWKFLPPAASSTGGIATEATSTNVTSVVGTINRISSTGGSTPVIDIASNYAGQTSITTLGNIVNGTWNASVISSSKGGAGSVNGLLKANGTGTVSAAVKGTDYAPALKITTTGSSGASTYNSTTGVLNIPVYAGGAGSNYTFTSPLSLNGTTVSIPNATALTNGFLSSTDWVSFNQRLVSNAQIPAGTKTKISYDSKGLVTSGTDATTADIVESSNLYFTQERTRNTLLTGLQIGSDTSIVESDNLLVALGKLQSELNQNKLQVQSLNYKMDSLIKSKIIFDTSSHAGDITNGLLAYFPFNGGAKDESGHNSPVSLNNCTLTQDRFGVADKAFYFDNSSIITYFDNSFLQNGYALSFWVKVDSLSNEYPTIVNAENNAFVMFYIRPNQTYLGSYYTDTLGVTNHYPGVGVTSGIDVHNWNHIVMQFDKTLQTNQLYVNGFNVSSSLGYPVVDLKKFRYILFGGGIDQRFQSFNGKMDEIRIYNRPLLQNEITSLYEQQ